MTCLALREPLSECVKRTQKKLTSPFVVHVLIKGTTINVVRVVQGELKALVALQEIYRSLNFDLDRVYGKITCQGLVSGVAVFGVYYSSGGGGRVKLSGGI